jgi:hypothetical protein
VRRYSKAATRNMCSIDKAAGSVVCLSGWKRPVRGGAEDPAPPLATALGTLHPVDQQGIA